MITNTVKKDLKREYEIEYSQRIDNYLFYIYFEYLQNNRTEIKLKEKELPYCLWLMNSYYPIRHNLANSTSFAISFRKLR